MGGELLTQDASRAEGSLRRSQGQAVEQADAEGGAPASTHDKLGQSLALSHLAELPALPGDELGQQELQQHEYAVHLDSAMLTYTPAPGRLASGGERANRFEDQGAKRKIYVNKEVSRVYKACQQGWPGPRARGRGRGTAACRTAVVQFPASSPGKLSNPGTHSRMHSMR